MYGTSNLLTINPGVSLQVTGDLPIRLVTSCRAWKVSSDVLGVLMISTNFIAIYQYHDCASEGRHTGYS